MKTLLFRIKWWKWFLSSPTRISFGFGPHASEDWNAAMDLWEAREPKS